MIKKSKRWTKLKDINYENLYELEGGKLAVAVRGTGGWKPSRYEVQLIKYDKHGTADLVKDVDVLRVSEDLPTAKRMATKKRREYLKLIRHLEKY